MVENIFIIVDGRLCIQNQMISQNSLDSNLRRAKKELVKKKRGSIRSPF